VYPTRREALEPGSIDLGFFMVCRRQTQHIYLLDVYVLTDIYGYPVMSVLIAYSQLTYGFYCLFFLLKL